MKTRKLPTLLRTTLAALACAAGLWLVLGNIHGADKTSKENARAEYRQALENDQLQPAYFAGGCFWCTEAVFEAVPGVEHVISGYAGGSEIRPSYMDVARGKTSHTETIAVFFDPNQTSYKTLLDWFWKAHDPTQVNRQGPDYGTQYRSAIFTTGPEQKQAVEKSLAEAAKNHAKPIATQVSPLEEFYVAEDYHQNFADKNPDHPYLRQWLYPKEDKLNLDLR
jgi:peptide-methionine (S)-S-oxide reductase